MPRKASKGVADGADCMSMTKVKQIARQGVSKRSLF